MSKIKEIPFIRRFWSDLEKAKAAARKLWSLVEQDESIYVVRCSYGLYGTINYEYSVRLKSEGQRFDSDAIIYRVNYYTIKNS